MPATLPGHAIMTRPRVVMPIRTGSGAMIRIATRMSSSARLPLTQARPAPPRLPAEQQQEFEELQRQAESSSSSAPASSGVNPQQQYHPDFRGRTIAEFEGDVNPKTGEIGGPKQDPLRHGDYAFNGRVTDF
ncbi:hypothetical protein V1514DRAFT_333761 [Lipomyces japonicus]|uniref:uncharacterized protein n=1 Tax=Lipomyces japonicus TaxID=56871 RepID=UPI0034CF84F3